MSKEESKKLTQKLYATLKERKMSVPKLSTIIGIPKDRIYKWRSQNSGPGIEDYPIIKNWLENGNMDSVPRGTSNITKDIGLQGYHKSDRDKYIELLERDRDLLEQMQEVIRTNLTELLTAQRLNRAQLTVITDLGTKTLATVQKRSLEMVREETSKNLNDIVARQLQTDTAAGT